ncbi:PLG [Mytilus edulis]|uniref:PLG n=1 Tax=Mytilus edulis TaxID=6550 RepID=A0A8S3V6Z0_MYTED|nr:PLG [Mytilus edulis]
MGKNKLGELIKVMSEKGGLTGRKVNHSARNHSDIIAALSCRGNNSNAVNWTHKYCKVDQYGESYEGKINTTISGRTCQSWKLQSPHQHERDPFDHNYCRNPSKGLSRPWCYTTDIRVRSEYCPVYLCGTNCSKGFFRCKDGKCIIDYWQCNGIADCAEAEDESFCDEMPECLEDGKSVLYRGKRNVTASGIPCQYWSSTSPHSHTYQFNAENYCRNSDRTTLQAWCYTQDANVRWEYCDIPVCPFVTTVSQPETSTESQRVTSTVSQPVTSTVSQPVTSTVLQPVTSTVSQPVTSTVSQPVTSTVSQPVTSTVSQPVTSFESQPVTSPVSQLVASALCHNLLPLLSVTEANCACLCQTFSQFNSTTLDLELRLAELNRILRVDKHSTKLNRRTKTSAVDNRVSAKSLGCVSVTILIGVALFIVFLDIAPKPL